MLFALFGLLLLLIFKAAISRKLVTHRHILARKFQKAKLQLQRKRNYVNNLQQLR